MRTSRITILALLTILVCSIAFAQPHYKFTQVVSLDPYGGYREPATLTNRGDVLFAPGLQSGGEAVILWSKGKLNTIAAAGQVMPNGGVLGYTDSPVQMNDEGDVAFIMTRNYLDSPAGHNSRLKVRLKDVNVGVSLLLRPGIDWLVPPPRGSGRSGARLLGLTPHGSHNYRFSGSLRP